MGRICLEGNRENARAANSAEVPPSQRKGKVEIQFATAVRGAGLVGSEQECHFRGL